MTRKFTEVQWQPGRGRPRLTGRLLGQRPRPPRRPVTDLVTDSDSESAGVTSCATGRRPGVPGSKPAAAAAGGSRVRVYY
jgi:hypothetical protein